VTTFLRRLLGFAALLTSQLEIGAILIPLDTSGPNYEKIFPRGSGGSITAVR
jgi:hypothetical protein